MEAIWYDANRASYRLTKRVLLCWSCMRGSGQTSPDQNEAMQLPANVQESMQDRLIENSWHGGVN